jgi:uncharacterized membrane protein
VEFVNPNLHVALVHYPLALLISGTLIELFSFLWRRHGFRAAGRWMILLGALSAIPTVLSGVYALYDVANPTGMSVEWKQAVKDSPLNNQQWTMLKNHLLLETSATALAVLGAMVWIGCSDSWRHRLHLPLLSLLIGACALSAAGAWYAGEVVYRFGTGVGLRAGATTQPMTIEYFVPPLQTHMIFAGATIALALAALALAIRNLTLGAPATQVDFIAAALGAPATLIGGESEDALPPEPADVNLPWAPAARFWLLAALIGLVTAGLGVWVMAGGFGTWAPKELFSAVRETPRRLAHVIAGGSIVVLLLILAMAARWGTRQKWVLLFFATLLVIAVAMQVWLGILMLYDTPQGPLMHFN